MWAEMDILLYLRTAICAIKHILKLLSIYFHIPFSKKDLLYRYDMCHF